MIGDLDSEIARAEDKQPFSNSTDGDAWTGKWCDNCACNIDDDCALVTVAMLGMTPFGWIARTGGRMTDRYLCAEFREIEDKPGDEERRSGGPGPVGAALPATAGGEPAGRHRGQ